MSVGIDVGSSVGINDGWNVGWNVLSWGKTRKRVRKQTELNNKNKQGLATTHSISAIISSHLTHTASSSGS
jgi:ribonucleotide reductase alpha subunit